MVATWNMSSKHQKSRVGDIRWRVEWCSELCFYEGTGDVDRDRCVMKQKSFLDRNEAEKFAESVFPETTKTFGIVELDQMEFMPYDDADAETMPNVGYWQVISNHIYSGEWET